MSKLAALALPFFLVAGCATPELATLHDRLAAARDADRTRAARVAAGIDAARRGVGLGCVLLNDLGTAPALAAFGTYCAAREALIRPAPRDRRAQ